MSNETVVLRSTDKYELLRGYCYMVRYRGNDAEPKLRTIPVKTAIQLEGMSDSEFNGSCVLELGVGAFCKRKESL